MSTLLVTRQNKNGINHIVPHNNDHAFLHFTNGSISIVESRMQELIQSAGLHGWVVNQVRMGEEIPEAPTDIDFIATENIDQISKDYPQSTIQIRGKLSHRVLIPFANSKPLIRLVSVGQGWMDADSGAIQTVTSIDDIGHTFFDKKNPRNRMVNVIDENGSSSGYRIGNFINNHWLVVGVDRSELVTKSMIEEIQQEPSSGILSDNLQDIQELCDDLDAGKQGESHCQRFATFAKNHILSRPNNPMVMAVIEPQHLAMDQLVASKDNAKEGEKCRFTMSEYIKGISKDMNDALMAATLAANNAKDDTGAKTRTEVLEDYIVTLRGLLEAASKECIELRGEVESLKAGQIHDAKIIHNLQSRIKDMQDSEKPQAMHIGQLKDELRLLSNRLDFCNKKAVEDFICSDDILIAKLINKLTDRSHKNNHQWWHDKDGNRIERNKAELLCMVHTEISEAVEGERKDLNDDKLPHRKMAEVELADAVERIFDYAGAFGYDLGGALMEKQAYNRTRADHTHEEREKENGKKF